MSDEIIRFDDAMFGSAVIERCRRRESSVEEALMEMCLAGVSTRGVDDIGIRVPVRVRGRRVAQAILGRARGERERPRRHRRQQPPDLVSAGLRNGSCPHRTRFCGARTSHT